MNDNTEISNPSAKYPFKLVLKYIKDLDNFGKIQGKVIEIDQESIKQAIEIAEIIDTCFKYFESNPLYNMKYFSNKLRDVINGLNNKKTEYAQDILFELKIFRMLIVKGAVRPFIFGNGPFDIIFEWSKVLYAIECERRTTENNNRIVKNISKFNNDLKKSSYIGFYIIDVTYILKKEMDADLLTEEKINNYISKYREDHKEYWQIGNRKYNNNLYLFDNVKAVGLTVDKSFWEIVNNDISPLYVFFTHVTIESYL